jgi:hypothetical protein
MKPGLYCLDDSKLRKGKEGGFEEMNRKQPQPCPKGLRPPTTLPPPPPPKGLRHVAPRLNLVRNEKDDLVACRANIEFLLNADQVKELERLIGDSPKFQGVVKLTPYMANTKGGLQMGYLGLNTPVDYEKLVEAGVNIDLINDFVSTENAILSLCNEYISTEAANEALGILEKEIKRAIENAKHP